MTQSNLPAPIFHDQLVRCSRRKDHLVHEGRLRCQTAFLHSNAHENRHATYACIDSLPSEPNAGMTMRLEIEQEIYARFHFPDGGSGQVILHPNGWGSANQQDQQLSLRCQGDTEGRQKLVLLVQAI